VTYVKAEVRREQLIAAAIAVMRRGGIDAITSRAVAAEAGAPLASIHYTFGSVEDLVLAAYDSLIDEVAAEMLGGIDYALGFAACIPALFKRVAKLLDDDRYGVLLGDLNPNADPRIAALERRYYALGEEVVAAIASASGERPAVPKAQAARLIMAAIDGVIAQFETFGDVKQAKADLAAFADMLVGKIAPR
jgi:AcrR family transcriptional regulator